MIPKVNDAGDAGAKKVKILFFTLHTHNNDVSTCLHVKWFQLNSKTN